MDKKEEDRATLTAVVNRFNKWRFAQAKDIKERLERGEPLTERDLQFLGRVFEASKQIMPIIERNPEYQELASKVISLIHEISQLALNNEQLQELKRKS